MLKGHLKSVLVSGILALTSIGSAFSSTLVGTSYGYPYPYGPLHPYGPPKGEPGDYGSSGWFKIGDTNTPTRTGIAFSQHGQDSLTVVDKDE